MNKGNWEKSEDFRKQLKDADEAQSLEQASKAVNDSKGLEDLIRQTYEKYEQEPQNLNHYRQLSEYYHRYGDLENAIAWIQEARKLETGQADVSLEERERQLTIEYFDGAVETALKEYNENPNDENARNGWEQAVQNKKNYQRVSLIHSYKDIPTSMAIAMNSEYYFSKNKTMMVPYPTFNWHKGMQK